MTRKRGTRALRCLLPVGPALQRSRPPPLETRGGGEGTQGMQGRHKEGGGVNKIHDTGEGGRKVVQWDAEARERIGAWVARRT